MLAVLLGRLWVSRYFLLLLGGGGPTRIMADASDGRGGVCLRYRIRLLLTVWYSPGPYLAIGGRPSGFECCRH